MWKVNEPVRMIDLSGDNRLPELLDEREALKRSEKMAASALKRSITRSSTP